MPKKSLYLFLTSLLGVLLFLILHRLVVFLYFYLFVGGYFNGGLEYFDFLVWDYFSLTITLMLGSWYGIWLGLGWYDKVYIQKVHGGFVDHVAGHVFSRGHDSHLAVKLAAARLRLETDARRLEDLAQSSVSESRPRPAARPAAKKRRVVRKKAVS